jgi:hypothetical protein
MGKTWEKNMGKPGKTWENTLELDGNIIGIFRARYGESQWDVWDVW